MTENRNKSKAETALTDSKKRNNGEVPSPAMPKGSKFADMLSKISSLCTEMKNDPAGALDYERTIEENARLKATLTKRDDELDSLKTEVHLLKQMGERNLATYGKKVIEFNAKVNDVDSIKKSLAMAESKLEDANGKLGKLDIDYKQLDKKAHVMEGALKRAERQLSETQIRCNGLHAALQAAEEKISSYGEDVLSWLDLEDEGEKFKAFAEQCHKLVMECFQPCKAPPKSLREVNKFLERFPSLASTLPLTDSTSQSAILMRCAAAEFVIASVIVDHIFTDIYLPGDGHRQKAVSTTLELLDDWRESVARCQLLKTYPVNSELLSNVRQAASEEICTALNPLLPAGNPQNKFHTNLEALLGQALDLWQPLQRSKIRVSAELPIDTTILKRYQDAYSDYDGPISQAAVVPSSTGFSGSQPVLSLFPLICTSQDDVYTPKALWSDQWAYVNARNEAAEVRMDLNRSPLARRRLSVGARAAPPSAASLPPTRTRRSSADMSSNHLVPSRRGENGIESVSKVQ